MAAVLGGDDARIAAICEEESGEQVVSPANFNSPGQVVIAGHAEAVDRVLERLAGEGVKKAVKLAMSVPSHCALMHDAAEKLAEHMHGITWHEPSLPVVQNADAAVQEDLDAVRDALRRQLFMPVRWTECVQVLAADGITALGECGPGKVLTGLARRIDRSLEARALGMPDALEAARAEWA
jgi:[acyl-carrier-protein] S-malonyltransferase